MKTLIIHPLNTAYPAGLPNISPAAQLLLSGADRNMFTVGAGDDEVTKSMEVLAGIMIAIFNLVSVWG